jgi:chromosome segregation protein
VPGIIRERNNRAQRVAGMQRNIESFELHAEHLLRDLGPDLAALPADIAVDRLTAARAAETRRTETRQRLTEVTRAREAAPCAAGSQASRA